MRTTLQDDFKQHVLHSGNNLNKLIAINIAVYLLLAVLGVFSYFSQFGEAVANFERNYLAFSSSPLHFLYRPWTIFTYQFIHLGLMHLVFNMIMLFFAGRIFREYLGDRKLVSVYLLGGAVGALLYMLAFQLIPEYSGSAIPMFGASASILAVLAAAGTLLPNYTVYLVLIGPVKLVYLVIIFGLLDIINLASSNSGGHFAHLGGALWGFVYIRTLQNGTDLGGWVNKIMDWANGLFRKKSNLRVKHYAASASSSTRARVNAAGKDPRRVSQDEIDAILDKIAKSGYDSLNQHEKDTLFRASKEN